MARKLPKGVSHKAALKAIRPFVGINADLRKSLTPSQKGQITRYYTALFGGLDRSSGEWDPGVLQGKAGFETPAKLKKNARRFKSKKDLRAAQEWAHGTTKGLPQLKVAFVEPIGNERPQLRFKGKGRNRRLVVKTKKVSREYFPFRAWDGQGDFAGHMRREGQRITKTDFDVYIPQLGAFERRAAFDSENIVDELVRLANKYSEAPRFLLGLNAMSFQRQNDFDSFIQRRAEARQASKGRGRRGNRRNARRRN